MPSDKSVKPISVPKDWQLRSISRNDGHQINDTDSREEILSAVFYLFNKWYLSIISSARFLWPTRSSDLE